ncbi:carboxypeptidase-like regulatory domain-containing protein [Spirilliplanes yamanashiensis]|uniref:Carboxypeptidase family protein n=1 Tax=Spirilliplanes yamanashiensis TaxID=42233 RepID=A0A8J3Y7M1_9ACTN|nr:carboxypeptidase-like regulatory domain-containing protein [Spirilliplanes yamanashiensis]MDP9815114.1 hypothetical protein [Spirilliplanes yamanashiensis]GIJ02768.1 hypothetical protein Sya03_21200 [Spirilliplanes yamanashiensis]
MFGAGVFLAVVGGSLLLAPGAAHAAVDPVVTITSANGSLRAGETTKLAFQVTNKDPQTQSIDIVVSGDGVTCAGSQCDFTESFDGNQTKPYVVDLVAGDVKPGDQKNGSVQIVAAIGGDDGKASRRITVRGPDAVQRIDGIKGRVRDQFNAAVPGATVAYSDSAGHRGETTSDGDGNYSFPSTDQNPISPGRIEIGARKDGFSVFTTSVNGQAGRSVTANLTLAGAAATPTATPTATPSATLEPSEEVVEEVVPEATTGAPALQAASDDEGSSSLVFIIAGALLVAVGIGAIILVFVRRKEKDGDDDDPGLTPAGVPAAAPAQRYGAADATRVAARTGGLPPPDATMVTSGAAIPPALANAQTMLHQAVPADDEFPDPYGAPARPVSGAHPQTWNQPPAGPYGAAPAAPTYGTPAAPPQRYEEPTGMYQPDRGGAYPQQGGTYGGGVRPDEPYRSGGYGGGYEQPPAPQGGGYGAGIDAGGGYGGARGTGSYGGGAPQAGGYDEPTTYGRPPQGSGAYGGGYEPPQPPPQQPGPYGAPRGGYDEQTGYYGGGAPDPQQPQQPGPRGGYDREDYDRPPPQGGQRRSLDWLDD